MGCDVELDIIYKNQRVYAYSIDWIAESEGHLRLPRIVQTRVFHKHYRNTLFKVHHHAYICLVWAIFDLLFSLRKCHPHVDRKPLEFILCRWKLQCGNDIQIEIMNIEEIDTLVITVNGEWVEREVKEIFEMRSDRSLDLPTSGIKSKYYSATV